MGTKGILLSGILIALALAACKKDEAEQAAAKTTEDEPAVPDPVAAVEAKVDEVKAIWKEGEPLGKDAYEQLIVAHASCEIKDDQIDPKCPAVEALKQAMNATQKLSDLGGMSADLGRKLIGHESPAVRIKAAGMMESFFGTDTSSQDAVVEQARKETDPSALKAMIRTVWNDGAKNPKVAELLLWAADHADARVRKQAAYALSSPWNREMPGAAAKLAALMAGDADAEVRQTACERAGEHGNDELLPTYEKLTKDTADGELWGACFAGIVKMWASYPLYDTASKKAYQLTLKLLEKAPRSEHVPPWQVMGDFEHLATVPDEDWKKMATFYKAGDVRKALAAVIADPKANWMARSGAVGSYAALGASKKDLEKLKAAYASPEGTDSHVIDALDKAIAAAK